MPEASSETSTDRLGIWWAGLMTCWEGMSTLPAAASVVADRRFPLLPDTSRLELPPTLSGVHAPHLRNDQ